MVHGKGDSMVVGLVVCLVDHLVRGWDVSLAVLKAVRMADW